MSKESINDWTRISLNPRTGVVQVDELAGVVGDGVTNVRLSIAGKSVAEAPVKDNVYRLDGSGIPSGAPSSIQALNASGSVVDSLNFE